MIVELVIGAVITALFALIAYFLNRLISQNDRFQDETRRTHKVFGRAIRQHQASLYKIQQDIENGSLDEETKRKITTLTKSLMEIQKELSLIKPTLEKADENYGKIIIIGEQLQAQEQKLKGMYDALKMIIENKKDQTRK